MTAFPEPLAVQERPGRVKDRIVGLDRRPLLIPRPQTLPCGFEIPARTFPFLRDHFTGRPGPADRLLIQQGPKSRPYPLSQSTRPRRIFSCNERSCLLSLAKPAAFIIIGERDL